MPYFSEFVISLFYGHPPKQEACFFPLLTEDLHRNHCRSQHHQHDARDPVKQFGARLIGKQRCHARACQGGSNADDQRERIRHAADRHMGYRAGEGGKRHDKYAGADRRF